MITAGDDSSITARNGNKTVLTGATSSVTLGNGKDDYCWRR